ncbi:putative leucine-rich repeat-containing protein DDB_G0290503 [Bombus huntii]|uniref:putative leucine-rich repeat-containing protein DDB_G0290503 n=1 Tax=Bombus huntii TaxID=85661 RepID=UPI0021A99551|nr:putative leucine-rich repeat-containing protein DDB_G0290503 [Bombus huntii]
MFCGNEDEFEPRITPRPASKLDCFAVPCVPEVSLIFDKPVSCKSTEHAHFCSPSEESKGLRSKSSHSSPLNVNGSYAAWKEQNYLGKPLSSKVNDCIAPLKEQSNQNYILHSYLTEGNITNTLNESKRKNYALRDDIYNSSHCKQKSSRENNDSPRKYNYEGSESNTLHTDKEQNTKIQCNNKIRHIDSLSAISQVIKPRINADNYKVKEDEYSSLLYERQLAAHNSNQQKVYNDSVPESNVQNVPTNPGTLQRNELQLPHYLGQQYPYFNMNAYPFPQLHPYPTNNTDNQETVKNLLQIINSQNEQIKSLQIQVDRLLKIQEENLKERKKCSCSFQLQTQSDQFHTNSNNVLGTSNYVTVPENTKRSVYRRDSSQVRKKENCNKNENINQNELILTDAQSKKAFMQQKVSIGVMTSFEFTVQNNPFTMDIENYEKKDGQQKQENLKMCNSVGSHDTNESLRRYKNSFTRMPGAQLENIVEDSESYMSSSQQQSSNLNATTSTKDLEKQAYVDIRRETDTHRSESPKLCKDETTKSNETENRIKKHLENCTVKTRNYENIKTPMIQRNHVCVSTVGTECTAQKNTKFIANTFTNVDQDKEANIQRDNSSVKTNNFVNNSRYHNDYQQEGQPFGLKQNSNCIEDSLILNSDDLKINERPLSPEPSIHIEMQEYSSDDDSENVKRSSKVGWTFYNDVLGQVNQLLQNSCIIDDQQQKQTKVNQNERDETDNRAVLDTVKVATLQQLKKFGISLSENSEAKELNNSNKMAFDLPFYPRLDYQTNMTQATSAVNETNTSMHMKALALKYLTDEQLAELAVQRQGASVNHLMVSNLQGTNMSFATMRYLQRYQLVPGKNNIQTEDINALQNEMSPKADLKVTNPRNSPKQRLPFSQTPRTTCPSKILDISALKQQPKLL